MGSQGSSNTLRAKIKRPRPYFFVQQQTVNLCGNAFLNLIDTVILQIDTVILQIDTVILLTDTVISLIDTVILLIDTVILLIDTVILQVTDRVTNV